MLYKAREILSAGLYQSGVHRGGARFNGALDDAVLD